MQSTKVLWGAMVLAVLACAAFSAAHNVCLPRKVGTPCPISMPHESFVEVPVGVSSISVSAQTVTYDAFGGTVVAFDGTYGAFMDGRLNFLAAGVSAAGASGLHLEMFNKDFYIAMNGMVYNQFETSLQMAGSVWVVKHSYCCGDVGRVDTTLNNAFETTTLAVTGSACPAGSPVESGYNHAQTSFFGEVQAVGDLNNLPAGTYQDTFRDWIGCVGALSDFSFAATNPHCFVESRGPSCPSGYAWVGERVHATSGEEIVRAAARVHHEELFGITIVPEDDLYAFLGSSWYATDDYSELSFASGFGTIQPGVAIAHSDIGNRWGTPTNFAYVNYCCRHDAVGGGDCGGWGAPSLNKNACECTNQVFGGVVHRTGTSCEHGVGDGQVDEDGSVTGNLEDCDTDVSAGGAVMDIRIPTSLDVWNHVCNVHLGRLQQMQRYAKFEAKGDGLRFSLDPATPLLARIRLGTMTKMRLDIRRADDDPMWEPFWSTSGTLVSPDTDLQQSEGYESGAISTLIKKTFKRFEIPATTTGTTLSSDFPSLTDYKVRLVFGTVHSRATAEMDEITWRSWWSTFSTTCGCDWGGTGAPASVSATQSGKAIYFSWVDDSTCEARFNVYRIELDAASAPIDSTTAFINAFAFTAAQQCGIEYSPTSGADLVEELTLGTTYRYCIEAQTSSPKSFTSPRTCDDLTIAWTGIVFGQVATKGGGGVRDTAVSISHPLLNGGTPRVVQTNAQGEFFETLTIPGVSTPVISITVAFAKSTGGVPHEYECGGAPCTQIDVDVAHLSSGRAAPIDVSTISVDGIVTYADTAPWTGTVLGSSRSPGPPCAVIDSAVRVCAHDASSGGEIECVPVSPGGSGNEPAGSYRLTVPIGVTARISVNWRAGDIVHTFSPDRRSLTAGSTDIAGIDFEDTTTQLLTVNVHASACELYIGPTTLQAQMSTVCPSYKRDLYVGIAETDGSAVTRLSPNDIKLREGLQTGPSGDTANFPIGFTNNMVANELLSTTYAIPAALIDVFPPNVQKARAASQTLADVVAFTGISEPNVPQYFEDIGLTYQTADLRTGGKTITYEYREPAVATITKWPAAQAIDCSGKVTPRPPVSAQPGFPDVYILKAQSQYTVDVEVVETYASNIGSCSQVPGSATVLDTASPTGPCAAAEEGPCTLTPTIGPKTPTSSEIVTKFSFPVFTGYPNPSSFYAPITISYVGKSGMATVETVIDAIVTGKKPRGQPFLVPMPPYQVSAFLHDPPGGNSFAGFSSGDSASLETTVSDERTTGLQLSQSLTVGVEAETEVCVGLGAAVCQETLSVEVEAGVSAGIATSTTQTSDTSNGITLEAKEEYTTSPLPESPPGRDSDLVVAPVYVVKYSLADIVAFDSDACTASTTVDLAWIAAPKSSAKPSALVINAILDIETITVPALERLKLLTPPAETFRISLLQQGVDGWTKLVADNDARIAAASPAATADTILFAGGGASFTRESSGTIDSSYTASDTAVVSGDIGLSISASVSVASVSVGSSTDFAWNRETSTGKSGTSAFSSSTTSSFTLSDPDPGDSIEVITAIDPVFGTPLFKTTGGMTKCPAEPGTNHRETFSFVPVGTRSLVDLPPDGTGVLELEIRNESPNEERIFLSIQEIDGTNPEGLKFDYNGETLARGRTVEAPYNKNADGSPVPGGQIVPIILSVNRGPRAYKYEDVKIRVGSICEQDLEKFDKDQEIAVSAEFLQPCASIDWAGQLRLDGKWAVNAERVVDVDTLRGFAKNPEFGSTRWASHPRVETVALEYRLGGDVTWRPARQADTAVIAMEREPATAANALTSASVFIEDPFGFATFAWDLANFADGAYDVRGYVRCTPKFGGSELDYGVSTVLPGVLDRVKPQLFGRAQPADGEYFPGDVVSFTFDEDINCNKPFVFQLALQIAGTSYAMSAVPIKCSGDTITIDIENVDGGPLLEAIGGATVVVSVANVRDTAGNIMADAVAHSFTVFQITPSFSSATIAGVHYGVAYADAVADRTAFANLLITEVEAANVAALGAAAAGRVTISDIKPTRALQTSVTFFVSAGAVPTAASIANTMRDRINAAARAAASDARDTVVADHAYGSAPWRQTVAARTTPSRSGTGARALPASISGTTLSSSAPSSLLVPSTADALKNTASSSATTTQQAAGAQAGTAVANATWTCSGGDGESVVVGAATQQAAQVSDTTDEDKIVRSIVVGCASVAAVVVAATVALALFIRSRLSTPPAHRHPHADKFGTEDAESWESEEATVVAATARYAAAPAPPTTDPVVSASASSSASSPTSSSTSIISSGSSDTTDADSDTSALSDSAAGEEYL